MMYSIIFYGQHLALASQVCPALRVFAAAQTTSDPDLSQGVPQALEHERNRDATGTKVSEDAQEHAMPEPQTHQAT